MDGLRLLAGNDAAPRDTEGHAAAKTRSSLRLGGWQRFFGSISSSNPDVMSFARSEARRAGWAAFAWLADSR
jgi:hypothetical protein